MRSSSRRYLVDDGTGSCSTGTGARHRFGSMRPFRHSRPPVHGRRRVGSPRCWSAPSARAGNIPRARHAASWAPAASAAYGSRSPSHPLSWSVATTTGTEAFRRGFSSHADPHLRDHHPVGQRESALGRRSCGPDAGLFRACPTRRLRTAARALELIGLPLLATGLVMLALAGGVSSQVLLLIATVVAGIGVSPASAAPHRRQEKGSLVGGEFRYPDLVGDLRRSESRVPFTRPEGNRFRLDPAQLPASLL